MKKLSTRLTAAAAGVALLAVIGVAQGQAGTNPSGAATTDSASSGNPWNNSNIKTPGPASRNQDQQTLSRDAAQEDRAVLSTDPIERDQGPTRRGVTQSREDRDARLRDRPATGPDGVDRDSERSMRAARPDRN